MATVKNPKWKLAAGTEGAISVKGGAYPVRGTGVGGGKVRGEVAGTVKVRRAEKVKQAAKEVTKPKRQKRAIEGSRVHYPSPNKPAGGRDRVYKGDIGRKKAVDKTFEKLNKARDSKAVAKKKEQRKVDASIKRMLERKGQKEGRWSALGKPLDLKNVRKAKSPIKIPTDAKVAAGAGVGVAVGYGLSKKKKSPVVIKKKSPVAKKNLRMDRVGKPSRYTSLKKRKG